MNAPEETPITEWVLGPYGELGIGPIQWPRLRSYLFWIWLPVCVLTLFNFGWATVIISICAVFILIRFSRLQGTPALVSGATAHWGHIVTVASVGLFALHLMHEQPNTDVPEIVYSGGCLLYLFATGLFWKESLLLEWQPNAPAFSLPEVTLDELTAAREEFTSVAAALLTFPLFDDKNPELQQAWRARNPGHIAELLQEGSLLTQDAWRKATIFHNDAVALVDRTRRQLSRLLLVSQRHLDYFKIDCSAIEVERSKLAHLTLTRAVPRKLTSSHVRAQQGAYLHGYAKVAVQGAMGSVSPVEALVGLGLVFALQLILTSRMLRRLKDVEGQLKVNAQTARGDLTIMSTLLTTRMIPQLEQMTSVIVRLEEALSALPRQPRESEAREPDRAEDPTLKEWALRLAFAVIEGRKLAGMTAGD
jgi:hypothetical protein